MSLFQIDAGPWPPDSRSPSFYLAEELMRQGRLFRFYIPDSGLRLGKKRQSGLPVFTLKGSEKKASLKNRRLIREMKLHICQLVHTHDVRFLPSVTSAAGKAKVPLQVVTWQGKDGDAPAFAPYSKSLQAMDLVVVRDKEAKDKLSAGGVDPKKLKLIPYGREFPPVLPPEKRNYLHRHWHLEEGIFLVGIKARLSRSATWTFLNGLHKKLGRSLGDRLRLVLFGTDGITLGARRSPVPDDLLFYLGEEEPPLPVLSSLGMLLVLDTRPRDKDYLRTIMAAGVPLGAWEKRGLPPELKQEETGFRLAPDKPSAAADCVERLWADRAWAKRMAEQAREVVLQNFSCQAMASRLIKEYDRLARRKDLVLA